MKKLILSSIFFSAIFNAQVGIATASPSRTLDVNGDLRVRTTTDKSTDSNYNKVIAADANGQLDAWDKNSLLATIQELAVENKKIVYFSNSPNIGSVMNCGKMEFRYETGPLPQMRLLTPANTTLYYTRILRANSNVNSFTTPNSVSSNLTAVFTTANNWITLDTGYTNNSLGEYYITYPGDTNLYRVTFLARNMNASNLFYTMVCEKF